MNVIAFDTFGTIFDLHGVDKKDIVNYLHHIRQPIWQPLKLPTYWETLPAYPDAAEGITELRKRFIVVTCSNGPLGLLTKLSKNNNIQWDAIIPLELNKVFKPNPQAYMTVCEVLDVKPSDVIMVTANKTFGDLEAASALGMEAVLIRGDSKYKTVIDLAHNV